MENLPNGNYTRLQVENIVQTSLQIMVSFFNQKF